MESSQSYQQVPVARIQALCDPFNDPPWDNCTTFSMAGVLHAIAQGRYTAQAFSRATDAQQWTADDHHARIAHLVVNGWQDPIQIDVGIPFMGCWIDWPVTDGNHRVAAAIVRGDETILASVAGCCDHIEETLGIKS